MIKQILCMVGLVGVATSTMAADYPPNIDYGSQGDFVVKRGTEYGRTADLVTIGPVLVNLPEAPGSSELNVDLNIVDTMWDLSSLTNPNLIRERTCATCTAGQPIHAHATVYRFDEELGALLYGGGITYVSFDPNGANSYDQVVVRDWGDWGYSSFTYTTMFAPYHIRAYWEYGFDTSGRMAIRNPAQRLTEDQLDLEKFGNTENRIWFGESLVDWDHLGLTGVTGFTAWMGNLLVVASDQQSTGMAVYDASGFKNGRVPRLLSRYQPRLTEPDGTSVGIGGYWVEPYGTNKMVWAARQRENLIPERHYPAAFIVDFTDPTSPKLTCELYFDQDKNNPDDGDDSSDPMYINFQDQYAYMDHFRIDIPACEAAFEDGEIDAEEFAEVVYKFADIDNGCDSSQYFRPLGQVGIFGGYNWWETPDVNEQGMCFFVTSDEPDTNPPYISGHRPLDRQTNYPVDGFIHIHIPETLRTETVENAVTVTNISNNQPVEFRMQLTHTGTLAIWPQQDLQFNATYRVEVTGIQDYMGNTMQDYAFTFSTGDDIQLPSPTATPSVTPTPTPSSSPTPPTQSPSPTPTPDYAPSYTGEAYYPNKSSQLACQPEIEDGNVWVVNPENDSVSILSRDTNSATMVENVTLLREIKLGYEHPSSVTKFGSRFAVTYQQDDKVIVYSANGYPLFAIDTGHGTQPIASISSDSLLYVALYGSGEVIKINSAGRIIARLNVGPKPKAMAMSGDRLLVTRFVSPMTHAEVYDIDVRDQMQLTRTIVVNKVTVPDDLDHGSGVPNYLQSIVINADATAAFITANKVNVDRGLQRNGLPLDDDNTVRPMIVILDLVNNRDANVQPNTRAGTIDLDNGAEPAGITFLANPAIRMHTLRGNNVVVANNFAANSVAQFSTGLAPQEMCTTLRTLFVKNFTERSVSVIDVAEYMHNGSLNPHIQAVTTVQREILTASELLGQQMFYSASHPEMGAEGYMSCASCHNEGGQDGMVWDISNMGEGLRNTLPLNGTGGTRFGNLHWSSNFDEVQDFELQIEHLNGGNGLIAGQTFTDQSPLAFTSSGLSNELDALASYIANLGKSSLMRSPHRTYTGQLTEAAVRGQAIFTREGCDSCHAGTAFRDGSRHDVGTIKATSGTRLGGTLDAIRTPTLVQLWDTAPYFHDGSAATLEEVLEVGVHNTGLNENDRAWLIEYLLSIDRESFIDDDELFMPTN